MGHRAWVRNLLQPMAGMPVDAFKDSCETDFEELDNWFLEEIEELASYDEDMFTDAWMCC
jgi:hypothetical protein